MKNEGEPSLEQPGSGLPRMELFMMRRGFPMMCRFRSRESLVELFEREKNRLLELVGSLSPEEASTRVLIKRIRSIEDSSRYWSAYMTLQHLHIVNLGIAGIIRNLSRGEEVEGEVRIENVKPDPSVGVEAVEAFQKSSQILSKTIASVEDLGISATHGHPWFGELNPKGWHTLTAIHMGIHRRQMELIIEGLKRAA